MIKLIAFDYNGTLLSDTAIVLKAENIALTSVGLKPITLKHFQETFQIPIIKYWENLNIPESFVKKHFQTIEDTFHLNYEKLVNTSRTRAGSKEVLTWLNTNQIQAVIYSNHPTYRIKEQLVRLKMLEKFNAILGRETTDDFTHMLERGKEKKLAEYIKKHKFKPHEVISIGDTEEEIEVGKKFGFYTVGITGGYNSAKRLKKHQPNFLIHNMLELKNIIKRISAKGGSAFGEK